MKMVSQKNCIICDKQIDPSTDLCDECAIEQNETDMDEMYLDEMHLNFDLTNHLIKSSAINGVKDSFRLDLIQESTDQFTIVVSRNSCGNLGSIMIPHKITVNKFLDAIEIYRAIRSTLKYLAERKYDVARVK
jgi:hypothetical protein